MSASRPSATSLLLLLLAVATIARAEELPCTPDAPLTTAAAELLLTGNGKAPDFQQLTAALRAADSEAVSPRALFLTADDSARATTWLKDLRAKSDADLICGDARSESARLIIASARGATLAASRNRLRGTLAPNFDKPELVFRRADGTLTRFATTPAELERGIPLDPEWQATQVQLVAKGPTGPRPVAERAMQPAPADSGLSPESAPPRRDLSTELSLSSDAPLDARGVFGVVAQLRERYGRPNLRANRLVDRVALNHARAVCAQGRVAHELEPGVTPETRVARAGLRAQLVGETVARAADAIGALTAMWQSPSHSLTLIERRFTDIGIGLASDEQSHTCLVIMLLAWPRPIPRAQ